MIRKPTRLSSNNQLLDPLILHIETSGKVCSVALSQGYRMISSGTRTEQYVHSAALAPMISAALKESGASARDLQAVSVSIGPGSYTGLRVGLSTAKAICFAVGCPLIAVDTLCSLAVEAIRRDNAGAGRYVGVLDARRQDAYFRVFDQTGHPLSEPGFCTVGPGCLDAWWPEGERMVICGEGIDKWREFASGPHVTLLPVSCDARLLVPLALTAYEQGDFADIHTCVPVYVKAPNITTPR